MMPVEINQWRATIGCFLVQSLSPLNKMLRPFSIFLPILKLYWFCSCFIAISTLVLPLTITIQFLAINSVATQFCFLPLFAHTHRFAKLVVYMTVELLKRIPLAVIGLIRFKRPFLKKVLFAYVYFYIGCLTCYTLHAQWLVCRTILLSGDVESNPGPETLDFCCWNLNSISAYDFLRVSLIEAYNSVYDYDLIGIVETHLDSTADENKLALNGYTFVKSNHPRDVKRGGVGLYIKDSLPSKRRSDLETLPECIVYEIQLNRKKYFFAVIYRSPSQDQSEFDNFTINFELMVSKMNTESPFCVIITGDFNCRSTQWWENDIENNEGKFFEPLTSDLGLNQLISEPTHLMGSSKSCIDLIFTDQPNLVIETGVHPSLHEQCHHQIVHGKLSVSNIAVPPYTRRIWYYDKADFVNIMKSIEMFRWQEHLDKIACPNDQVKLLNEVLLNIYSNYIPNQVKTIRPRQAPWITQNVKKFLRKKNHAYKNFVRSGQPDDKLEGIKKMISDGAKLIEDAKSNYLRKTGESLANPGTSSKTYWSLINTVLNKAKVPIIPPLLENGLYDSLYSHLVSCNLLDPNQSGFRPGDSTINQLLSITHTIFKAFDCNPTLDVRSVYLDISKAFDRVWHVGLIYKLKRCGVSGQFLSLVQSFLKDRKQRTVLNGQCSNWGDVLAGVPQGSILGPLFFLVYINDLTADLKCHVKLFLLMILPCLQSSKSLTQLLRT